MNAKLICLTSACLMTAVLASAGTAAADHDVDCGYASTQVYELKVIVSVWTADCTGASVHLVGVLLCEGEGIHEDVTVEGVTFYVEALDQKGCETGVQVA